MDKRYFFVLLVFLTSAVSAAASQIPKISFSELYTAADLIVMGEVVDVTERENQDRVTIHVGECLKGPGAEEFYTVTLVTRGGLKDFDPRLEKGDAGVFFLKTGTENNGVEKAYWGSVAVFPKNHFYANHPASTPPPEISLSDALGAWRAYRETCGQIKSLDAYEQGFQKGFTGPPGLVDGSADFNLGHSDGMLARENKLPEN